MGGVEGRVSGGVNEGDGWGRGEVGGECGTPGVMGGLWGGREGKGKRIWNRVDGSLPKLARGGWKVDRWMGGGGMKGEMEKKEGGGSVLGGFGVWARSMFPLRAIPPSAWPCATHRARNRAPRSDKAERASNCASRCAL